MLLCDKIEKNYIYYYRNISEKINKPLFREQIQEKNQENESISLKRPNNTNVTIFINNNDVIQSNKQSNCNNGLRSTDRRRSRNNRISRR